MLEHKFCFNDCYSHPNATMHMVWIENFRQKYSNLMWTVHCRLYRSCCGGPACSCWAPPSPSPPSSASPSGSSSSAPPSSQGRGGGYKAGQNFFGRQEFFRNFLLPFSTWALKTYDKALQICIKKKLFFPKKKFLPAPHPSEGD